VTELTTLTDPSPEVVTQAGVGPADTGPNDEGWTFFTAEPAVLWELGFGEAALHYDGYTATFVAPEPGAWQLAFRASADGGNTWTLCDRVDDGIFAVAHTTDLITTESACHPHPCVTLADPVCDGNLVSLAKGSAICGLDDELAVCTWPDSETIVDCAELGATCDEGECTGFPEPPGGGDVVISELLIIPATNESDEWIELSVAHGASTDVFDLAGCELTSDGGEQWVISSEEAGATLLWAGAPLVLARSADSATLGNPPELVYGNALVLDNLQDTLTLHCAEEAIDSVGWDTALGWPIPVGVSWSLAGNLLTATANDDQAAWCHGDPVNGTAGSPGSLNALCPPADDLMDDCQMLEPQTLSLDPGILFPVSGLLFDAGTTDATPWVDPAPGFVVEIGYGPSGSDPMNPSAGWAWAVAYPDPDWQDDDAPDHDRWGGPLVVYEAGVWDVAMRASAAGGANWLLCDQDGAANGYDPAEAGHLTVGAGVCVPNPCDDAPPPTCESDLLTVFEPEGVCTLIGEPLEADCSYTPSSFDCTAYGGCVDGACVAPPVAPAGFGELVISEVLRDSLQAPPDLGEWIEVFNPGTTDIDLRGCHLGDTATAIGGASPVVVPSGGYGLIANSGQTLTSAGGAPTAVLPSMSLGNVTDGITLHCAAGIIDDIAYTIGWPGTEGVSMQLGSDHIDGDAPAIINNLVQSWCAATEVDGSNGGMGSPGAANTPCSDPGE
jgi:hypothetical protein